KRKIGGFCGVANRAVIPALDADSIYAVPLSLEEEGLCLEVMDVLNLTDHESDMKAWAQLVHKLRNPGPAVKVALVGKYVQLNDAYLSVVEALRHACIAQDASLDLHWICSEQIEAE
ncbi:MAG: CTP synthase, partial [Prochlorococcus sp.]